MKYHIEHAKWKYDHMTITGWLVGDQASADTQVWAEDRRGNRLPGVAARLPREDVGRAYFPQDAEEMFGFRIRFAAAEDRKHVLCLSDGSRTVKRKIHPEQIRRYGRIADDFKDELRMQMGKAETPHGPERPILSPADAEKTEAARASMMADYAAQGLKFSFVIPAYNTEPEHLADLLESIWKQTYGEWELCLADGSPCSMLEKFRQEDSRLARILVEYLTDPRVKYVHLPENLGISGNTNAAFALAEGEYVVMVDHDDILTEDALEWILSVVAEHPKADFIYSDSDLTDHDNLYDYNPLIKPRWSQEMLYSANYITHLSVVRTSLLREIGGWNAAYDGAQDWDLFLRIGERTDEIYRVPWVLYHWRAAASSTARDVGAKPYARLAQLRAVQDHLDRRGLPGRAVFVNENSTCIRVMWDPDHCANEDAEDVILITAPGLELSQESAAELRTWARQPGMGVIGPRVLDGQGRILSQGISLTVGGVTAECSGWIPGIASTTGHSDWYRDHVVPEPVCYALSCQLWEQLGGLDESLGNLVLVDLCLRAEKAGYRNLSTPFAQVTYEGESLAAQINRDNLTAYAALYQTHYPTKADRPN